MIWKPDVKSAQRIQSLVESLADDDLAEIAMGLAYVVDDGILSEVIPTELMDDWHRKYYGWLGREQVVAMYPSLPADFRELIASGLNAGHLAALLLAAARHKALIARPATMPLPPVPPHAEYGPNNPPRLRKLGESVEEYRVAMGWANPPAPTFGTGETK